MLLEPDRFRHTPPIAPERSHGPPRPVRTADGKQAADAPPSDERATKPASDKS
jgi:hypothetical protein